MARRSEAPRPAPLTLQPSVLTAELVALAVQSAKASNVPLVLVAPPAPVERELHDAVSLLAVYGLTMRYLVEHGCPVVVLAGNKYSVLRADLHAFLHSRRADPNASPTAAEERAA